MDAKEAIKYFKFVVAMGQHYYPKATAFDSFAVAIEALEKQVPKEVTDEGYWYDGHFVVGCPNCGETIGGFDKFCSYCGQAIKNDKE